MISAKINAEPPASAPLSRAHGPAWTTRRTHPRWRAAFFAVGLAFATPVASQAQNLIQNPSFEANSGPFFGPGSVPPWTFSDVGSGLCEFLIFCGSGSAHSGSFYALVGDFSGHGAISQDVTVSRPGTYAFGFFYETAFLTGPVANGVTATVAGTTVANLSLNTGNNNTYTQFTTNVSLPGGLAAVQIDGNSGGGFNIFIDDVSLTLLSPTMLSSLLPPGAPTNVVNVAGTIDGFNGTLPAGFDSLFGLTGTNLTNALTEIDGEAATGAERGAFDLMNEFLGLLLDPYAHGRGGMDGPASAFAATQPGGFPAEVANAYAAILKAPPARAPSSQQRWSVWASGFGGYNKTNGDAVIGSHDLSARDWGFAAGLDYHVAPDTILGLALGGAGTNWGLTQGLGGGKSDAFMAGLYGKTHIGAAYVSAALAYANHWMSTDRIAFAGDHLTADFNAYSFGGRIEAGYRYALPVVAVTPYAALQAQSFHTPSYSETDLTAGGFGLTYNAASGTATRSELGAHLDKWMVVSNDAVLGLRAGLAWAHDWESNPSLTAAFQTLPGSSFIVNGATPAENSALVSAGTELRLANGVSILAKVNGEFADGSQTYSGIGTLRYAW